MLSTYPYPFDQPLYVWNVSDQRYWCTMVNKYRFPLSSVKPAYHPVILEKKCDTFEAEYEQYKAEQLAQQQQQAAAPSESVQSDLTESLNETKE